MNGVFAIPIVWFATSTLARWVRKGSLWLVSIEVLTKNNIEALHPSHTVDEVEAGSAGHANVVDNEVHVLRVAIDERVQGSLASLTALASYSSLHHGTYRENLSVSGKLELNAVDREEQALQVGKLRQSQS